ncbi:class C sortase [Scrofimicrobium sp. R131]|uniref:Class C sortase n=1 Tax=Scrofimicrobium appendicitidis TaxID=3079930 RepID=A0AAU7V6L3_9ACTO
MAGTAVRTRTAGHAAESTRRRWRFSLFNTLIAAFALFGLGALIYPSAASWVTQYNQSNVIVDQERADRESGAAAAREKLAEAREYNRLLSGVARYQAGSNIAEGIGTSSSDFDYFEMLNNDPTGMMARLKVPAINLDLPVYHGTSDATLLRGVGHLQGTALPVGGVGTRSVLTGHSGLANATIFTHLDRVKEGDKIVVEVLGEVLTYRVSEIRVVLPDESMYIKPEADRDLLTLVTCTPLGINTHRILVTGERVHPTPAEDLDNLGKGPEVPGFPWWLVILVGGTLLTGLWYWRAGYPPRPKRRRRSGPNSGARRAAASVPAQPPVPFPSRQRHHAEQQNQGQKHGKAAHD